MEKTIKKLNLASGRNYLEGYYNVDDLSMNPKCKVDKKADILKLTFKPNKFEEIFIAHFMMYLKPDNAQKQINKWYKWLKKGGELIIETSDAQKIAEMIIKNPKKVEQMFGYGDTYGHQWSYSPSTLKPIIKKAGFKHIITTLGGSHNRPDRDFTLICTK